MNPYIAYYRNQGGSGLAGFQGVRYQRGSGFFSRFASSALLPLLKFLSKRVLHGGVNLGSDVLAGQNFKDSVKQRLRETGKTVATDALNLANETVFRQQTGSGRRRRRATSGKRTPKRRTKVKRSVKTHMGTSMNRRRRRRRRRTTTTKSKGLNRRKVYKRRRHTTRRRQAIPDFLSPL